MEEQKNRGGLGMRLGVRLVYYVTGVPEGGGYKKVKRLCTLPVPSSFYIISIVLFLRPFFGV